MSGRYAADPRAYWTARGHTYAQEEAWLVGPGSLTEQQGAFLAERLAGAARVLEVGCGYGRLLKELRRRLPTTALVGVDFSESQLAQARAYLSGDAAIGLAFADGRVLLETLGTFDIAYTQGCLMHVPPAHVDQVRAELTRVAAEIIHIEETVASDDGMVFAHDNVTAYARRGWVCVEQMPYTLLVKGQHAMLYERFRAEGRRAGAMKRYAVLVTANGGWSVAAECDTLMEACQRREEAIGYCQPLIVEVIPAIEAYALAHREAAAEQIRVAYGKPR